MRLYKKIFILFTVLTITAALAAFFYFDRAAALFLEKKYNLNITYKECSKKINGELIFSDLTVSSRRSGLDVFCKKARIRPIFGTKDPVIDFTLRDVNFVKKGVEKQARYDTITALVSTPFSSSWKYREIDGQVEPGKDRLNIPKLTATSDEIRLSLKGSLFYNGIIDSDIMIYFAPALTSRIPSELAGTILTSEKDEWRSLSVRISGDPSKPSMQVSSKRFRLNISYPATSCGLCRMLPGKIC